MRKALVVFLGLVLMAGTAGAATITLSGGGNQLISGAIATATHGDIIEITDSEIYTETAVVGVSIGVQIVATAGENPTIVLDTKSNGFSAGAMTEPWGIGDNDGGTINIDCTTMTNIGIYGYQFHGTATFENLVLDNAGTNGYGTMFWGHYDSVNDIGGCSFNFDNCTFTGFNKGGGYHVGYIYGVPSADFPDTKVMNFTNCTFTDNQDFYMWGGGGKSSGNDNMNLTDCVVSGFVTTGASVYVASGDFTATNTWISDSEGYHIYAFDASSGFATTNLTLDHCVLYNAADADIEGDQSVVVQGADAVVAADIDHCDIIADRGVGVSVSTDFAGTVSITNSNIVCATGLTGGGDGLGTLTSNYNNLYCSGAMYEGSWVAGANDISLDPQYVDAFVDMTVGDSTVATGDDAGGPIGSGLTGGVDSVTEWSLF